MMLLDLYLTGVHRQREAELVRELELRRAAQQYPDRIARTRPRLAPLIGHVGIDGGPRVRHGVRVSRGARTAPAACCPA